MEHIGRNPFSNVRAPVVRSDKQWAYIDAAGMAAILDACPSAAWRSAFALARWGGLRLGEAQRLEWGHIDWDGRMLTVVNPGRLKTTKKRTRTLPIMPDLYAVIRAVYDAASPGSRGPCDGFPENNVYEIAAGILTRAKVPVYDKPFHTLRRNLVTDWVAVYPPLDVATWLGHDLKVAMEFYHKPKAETIEKVTGTKSAQMPVASAENPSSARSSVG
jgi:integrase